MRKWSGRSVSSGLIENAIQLCLLRIAEAIILESDRDGITLYTTKVQLLEILASICRIRPDCSFLVLSVSLW